LHPENIYKRFNSGDKFQYKIEIENNQFQYEFIKQTSSVSILSCELAELDGGIGCEAIFDELTDNDDNA
jgi:hypothetical protein